MYSIPCLLLIFVQTVRENEPGYLLWYSLYIYFVFHYILGEYFGTYIRINI